MAATETCAEKKTIFTTNEAATNADRLSCLRSNVAAPFYVRLIVNPSFFETGGKFLSLVGCEPTRLIFRDGQWSTQHSSFLSRTKRTY